MLHGKLLLPMTEIKDKKTISQRDNASIHTAAITKKVVSKYRNRIVIMASIES